MRFMMMAVRNRDSQGTSTAEAVARMAEYHKALQKSGVLLAFDSLFPASTGARVSYAAGKSTVTDVPFTGTNEAITGYWILQVRSREEALEWARRAPMPNHEVIEVRQIQETADFPDDARTAAASFERRNVVA